MTTDETGANLLGVVGGLGPLASAEFLRTIYEHGLGAREQHAPAVVMLSDPSFPDRTQTFLEGGDDILLARLATALGRLCEMGATRLVICCVTMHHVVPRLPPRLRERVVSLLDVIFDAVAAGRDEHLLVCSTGTRHMRVFERHDGWERARRRFVLPDEKDQDAIHHELIYRVKRNEDLAAPAALLETLLAKYGVGSFVSGCTEVHLLTKLFARADRPAGAVGCVDPLDIIARAAACGGLARLSRVNAAPPPPAWTAPHAGAEATQTQEPRL